MCLPRKYTIGYSVNTPIDTVETDNSLGGSYTNIHTTLK